MKQLWEYSLCIINKIPLSTYVVLVGILFAGLAFFTFWKGCKKGICYSVALLLIEYVFLIFCSAVLLRKSVPIRKYDFHLFWSYGQEALIAENIMNVLAFIPIGFLLGVSFKFISWRHAFLFALLFSISIELFQFVFYKGFCEIDDVMHNTAGCLMGYLLYIICRAS